VSTALSSEATVIELRDVTISSAHSREAAELEGVEWRIDRGDFWAVGGLHGFGKSNLLATVAGLVPPLRGAIRLFGRDIAGAGERELIQERRRIGLVFEEAGRMLKHLTVAENIALPLRYHFNWSAAEAEESVQQILQLTGLTQMAHNTSGMMSQNWQQRAGLARALALKPEVLLLDKPLIGLKANHRRWWMEFLERLAEGLPWTDGRPVTLAVTTDDLAPLAGLARQFALAQRGRWDLIGGREQWMEAQEKRAGQTPPEGSTP
jgi:ABC-type transporter Mla maintaining outer membrane lipid asymmetry ATPase subunit MlaF